MPSLVVIVQQIKEKRRGTQCSLYINKIPNPEYKDAIYKLQPYRRRIISFTACKRTL